MKATVARPRRCIYYMLYTPIPSPVCAKKAGIRLSLEETGPVT